MNPYKELADLMRKGAQIRPKCKGESFQYDNGKPLRSCALGAIWEARFKGSFRFSLWDLAQALPILHDYIDRKLTPPAVIHVVKNCPYNEHGTVLAAAAKRWDEGLPLALETIIILYNDFTDCAREEIADWIESVAWEVPQGEQEVLCAEPV